MNKVEERKYLDSCLSKLGIEFTAIDAESPDFDTIIKNTKVGIEVTELDTHDRSQVLRSIKATNEDIKQFVKSELEKRIDKNITLNYSLRSGISRRLNRNEKSLLINFLVEFAIKNLSAFTFRSSAEHFEYIVDDNNWIESIRLSFMPKNEMITVSTNNGYWCGSIPKAVIESKIIEKEKKIDFTRNKLNWLFIIITEEEWSNGADIDVLPDLRSKFDYIAAYYNRSNDIRDLMGSP